MREIKFRAWIKEEDIMTYFEDESYILNGDMSVDAFDYEKRDCENYFEPCYKTVDIELMQFTGLHDKNGKEIYESDIVEVTRQCIWEKGIVVFIDGCFFIKVNETLLALYECEPNNYELEVIGNIYENSNLLKGADNIE